MYTNTHKMFTTTQNFRQLALARSVNPRANNYMDVSAVYNDKNIFRVATVLVFVSFVMCSSEKYLEKRRKLLENERAMFTGRNNTTFNEKEKEVNDILLRLKKNELREGHEDESQFLAAQYFPKIKSKIDRSKVFSFIKMMPKGCSLHTHLLAGVNAEYIIQNYTYRENLYGCYMNDIFKLKFFGKHPGDPWKPIEDYRSEDEKFDEMLTQKLTLNQNVPDVWQHFKRIFSTLYDMVAYKPIFEDYIYQMLHELYVDNVYYTEVRGTFMPLYNLDGKRHSTEDFFKIFISVVEKFKKSNPKFLGVKYIHSIYRGVDKTALKQGLEELLKYKKMFPEFIIGLDFVGSEEEGHMLVDYYEELLAVKDEIKLFLHAGETPWFGSTDDNLADAILLNSSRIGHGFALPKHPVLLELATSKNIPIELCPISNQVLGLHQDPRTHPATVLLAKSYPAVICNDDPSVWNATGLSYDFYVVFMAMTLEDSGLEFLKKVAEDSIRYSAIDDKQNVLKMFRKDWDIFLDIILKTL